MNLILVLIILVPAQVAQRRSKQQGKLHTDVTGFTKTSVPTNLVMLILNGFDFLIGDYPETVMSNPFPVSHWFKQNTCLHYGFGWRPVDLHD